MVQAEHPDPDTGLIISGKEKKRSDTRFPLSLMNQEILQKLSPVTEEEKRILAGQTQIDRSIYMDGSRDVISGEKLLKPGQLIDVRPHTRFIRFPEHTHDYVEIVYMASGSTVHIVNKDRIILKTGELLLLGQNARQSIEAAEEKDIAVNFIVRPDFFAGTLDFLGTEETPLRHFITSCLVGTGETGYLYFQVADILPVQNIIENLLFMLTEDTMNRRGINQMTMGLLFTLLLEHTDRLTFKRRDDEMHVKVLRYIEENYRYGSLTELASLIPYDVAGLSRLIREKTGRTYTELMQEKRLSQAAWMLTNTDMKVNEISESVGYENISYFHRIFTARFGLSPKKYRDSK